MNIVSWVPRQKEYLKNSHFLFPGVAPVREGREELRTRNSHPHDQRRWQFNDEGITTTCYKAFGKPALTSIQCKTAARIAKVGMTSAASYRWRVQRSPNVQDRGQVEITAPASLRLGETPPCSPPGFNKALSLTYLIAMAYDPSLSFHGSPSARTQTRRTGGGRSVLLALLHVVPFRPVGGFR